MKHLLTLTALLLTFSGLAQQMPYNPDANGDDFVGVDDVLGVLGVYDTALMQPDLECDYEGTDLEQLLGGLIAGNLVLDSIYVEYLLVDTVTTYLPECPDPVEIETVLERSWSSQYVFSYLNTENPYIKAQASTLGYNRDFHLFFYPDNGSFQVWMYDSEVATFTSFESTAYVIADGNTQFNLPFDESWGLDEDGLDLNWRPQDWVSNCESFRVIPFWHEAE
jgi:hypothetical protein